MRLAANPDSSIDLFSYHSCTNDWEEYIVHCQHISGGVYSGYPVTEIHHQQVDMTIQWAGMGICCQGVVNR